MGDIRKLLGSRICMHRERAKLTQRALAEQLSGGKIDKGTIWRIENGRSWPTYDLLSRIGKTLNVELEVLTGIKDGPIPGLGIPRDLLAALTLADGNELAKVRTALSGKLKGKWVVFKSKGDEGGEDEG